MTSLPDNHVTLTNLNISSYGVAKLITFGQKVLNLDMSP